MKVNEFKNVKTPKVTNELTVDDVLLMIKNGYCKEKVMAARKLDKSNPLFKKIKENTPTWSPNACFHHRRGSSDIKELSNVIYIDIDEEISFKLINNVPYIYAAWKSFSGNGYGLLFKYHNLTINNFKNAWLFASELCEAYGVTVDKQTSDITRQNIISSDPDIYINDEYESIDANQIYSTPDYPTTVDYPFNVEWDEVDAWGVFDKNSTMSHDEYLYETVLSDYENKDEDFENF